ncbi:unnamed protein product [Camellia sinensis]
MDAFFICGVFVIRERYEDGEDGSVSSVVDMKMVKTGPFLTSCLQPRKRQRGGGGIAADMLHSGEQIVLGYIQNYDGDSDDDSVFPHLANSYTNLVEIGVSSIDLSDDEDTKSNEEDDDERMREVIDSVTRRAFREDESRRSAPLTTKTVTRVMEGWGPRILYWTKAQNSED